MTYQPNATPEPLACQACADTGVVTDTEGVKWPCYEHCAAGHPAPSAASFEQWLDECDAPALPDLPRRQRFSRRVQEDFRTGWDGGRSKALAAIEKWAEFIPAIRGLSPENAIEVLAGMATGALPWTPKPTVVVTAAMVHALRDKVDHPMKACHEALKANGGDATKAEEWLRLGRYRGIY